MARQSRSSVKSMLIVFFDYEGVVHHEYAPTGPQWVHSYSRKGERIIVYAINKWWRFVATDVLFNLL